MKDQTFYAISVVMDVVMLVVTVAMGIGLYWVGSKANDAGAKASKIDTLEDRLSAAQDKLIETKVAGHAVELKQSVDHLSEEVKRLSKRIDDGDGDIEQIGERNFQREVGLAQKFGEMQRWMLENFSGKADLRRHEESMSKKVDQLSIHLSEQDRKLAGIEARQERKS